MGEIIKEFDFLINEEDIDTSTFIDDSNKFIEKAKLFIEETKRFPDKTYQGIRSIDISDSIAIGKTDIMPWDHVSMTINVNKLKNIGNNKLKEFMIPSFVEEIRSIGNDDGAEFGYNQFGRNFLRNIRIPYSVAVIAPGTFAFYKKLENIYFEENSKLMYLGSETFVGCDSLHKLDLRCCKYLDTIHKNTFNGSGITKLKLNSNIKNIEQIINTNIKTIYIDNEVFNIKEFNERIINSNGAFWGEVDYSEI